MAMSNQNVSYKEEKDDKLYRLVLYTRKMRRAPFLFVAFISPLTLYFTPSLSLSRTGAPIF